MVRTYSGPPEFDPGSPGPKPPAPPGRKNPENKPLKIVKEKYGGNADIAYIRSLDNMLHCQALLIKAGKNSALPHFIAIVKELERIHGFRFEILEDQNEEA